ncbi:iron-sulfur cluster co-chaperone protein HscB [Periophthalmus magnuspinnatus]|uniref:iron-sulfur cluster co-chaperone protein HscB n=1 Tax=Periophthalmus magnuspinnatus TaxID=409849 RepID=UPI002436EC98|nr:iron-sulfur cluster co-chaperone protein HscB [Periophthalmus magnuspinnatus]
MFMIQVPRVSMLRVNTLRVLCRTGTLLQTGWSLKDRQSLSRAVTCALQCCVSTDSSSIRSLQQQFVPQDRGDKRDVRVRHLCTAQVCLTCWNCQHPLKQKPAFFCESCEVVQPPPEDTSYFSILECDCTFTLDTLKLQKKYLQLQRLLHPDNFSQKSEREQGYSESQSALVNKAYETLLKPLSRGLYMLELQGLNIEEGTDSAVNSELLMELMEINEALDAVETPQEANEIGQDTKGKLADLTEQIDTALNKGELQTAKALLTKMKYFANIEEKVKEKLSSFM